jgi:hypothetical protein
LVAPPIRSIVLFDFAGNGHQKLSSWIARTRLGLFDRRVSFAGPISPERIRSEEFLFAGRQSL